MESQAAAIPALDTTDEAPAADFTPETDDQLGELKNATIMMVDDEPIIIESLQMFLEDAGYQNFVTTNEPKRAINMLVIKKPDIVLLDVMMPGITGLDILTKMRQEEALKHVPVIILTSATDSETKLKALELGATDFLAKPVDPSELALRLRNTLAAKAHKERLMNFDSLTGLPNRRMFGKKLTEELARSKREKTRCAVLHIDLDRFKQINDTLGHSVGDSLLRAVAARLQECVQDDNEKDAPAGETGMPYLARLGGDEFTLYVPNVDRLEKATMLARRILATLKEPFRLHGREFFVTASVGIAVYPIDGDAMDALLTHADVAMSHAKERGRNGYQYYAKDLNATNMERLSLENQLRKALELKQLSLQFQPKIDIATGRITGAEALLRWKHPKLGLVPPDKFIPIAEETGLIVPFGEWTIYAACVLNKRWQEAGMAPVRVSVNVSSRQFYNGGRLKLSIRNAIERSGLDANHLGVELTESMIMENPRENSKTLQEIKEMGVMLSIDDFGTGYSSLSYLGRIPLDELKIDRSFLQNVPESQEDAAVVNAIIAMSHSLGLTVVAEGVETEAQLSFLKEHGCNECQGYYASKPLGPRDFLGLVTSNHKKTA